MKILRFPLNVFRNQQSTWTCPKQSRWLLKFKIALKCRYWYNACTKRLISYVILKKIQCNKSNFKNDSVMLNDATFLKCRGVLLTFIGFRWLKSKIIYTLTLQIVTKANKQKQMPLTTLENKGRIGKQIKMKKQMNFMENQVKLQLFNYFKPPWHKSSLG